TWRMAGGDSFRCGAFPAPLRVRPRTTVRRLRASGAIQASPVFDHEGTTYIADMAGGLRAVSARGREGWRVALGGGVLATPAVSSTGRVFAGTLTGEVIALDAETGSVVWRRSIPTRSDPRILSDLLYMDAVDLVVLSSWGGRFVALSGENGDTRFGWDAGVSPRSAATADNRGNIYFQRAVADRGVELVRIDGSGGEAVLHQE